jgi:hypothetical protein
MVPVTPDRRPGVAARRFGYAVAVLINLVIVYLLDVDPGWRAVPLLTDATTRVLGLVNLALVAGIVANLVYAVTDGPWVKRTGELISATISVVVLVQIWRVFPFDFGATTVPWGTFMRILLIVALAGTGIAVLVHAVALTRLATERHGPPGHGRHAHP